MKIALAIAIAITSTFAFAQNADTTIVDLKPVDLGLPSGTQWANINIAAPTPADHGAYFMWADTTDASNTECTQNNSKTYGQKITNLQGNQQLDAATAKLGPQWSTPSQEQIQELLDECIWVWTTMKNCIGEPTQGYLVVSRNNGNCIFIPAAGARYANDIHALGNYGLYWSSTPNDKYTNTAACFNFYANNKACDNINRYLGLPIRPVYSCATTDSISAQTDSTALAIDTIPHLAPSKLATVIDLGLPSGTQWANTNIGANNPADDGAYFMWGDTTDCTYKECNTANSITYGKKNPDWQGNKAFDAATATWGPQWATPTRAQIEELFKECVWVWTTMLNTQGNPTPGYLIVSKTNGNAIFLPAAGRRHGKTTSKLALNATYSSYIGELGTIWSSTSGVYDATVAVSLYFTPKRQVVGSYSRDHASPIRPILKTK